VNTKHEIRTRPTPWKTIILLCGKCSSKLDGGYGEGFRTPALAHTHELRWPASENLHQSGPAINGPALAVSLRARQQWPLQ
jgi:hypothetical protein